MSLPLPGGFSLTGKAAATMVIVAAAALAAGCGTVSASSAAPAGAASPATGAASGSGTPAPSGSSGAGSAAGPTATPVPTITATGAPVAPGQVQCADWPTGVPSGTLPLSFTPVSVLRCVEGTVNVPGKGTFLSATLQRATTGLAPLVAALRAPNGHRSTGQMCPMYETLPQHIVLEAKDGSKFAPTIPVDGCGHDQSQVLQALNTLPWQTVSVRLYAQAGASSPAQSPTPLVTPTRGAGMNGSPAVT